MGWHVNILTLFPDMFPGPLGFSIANSALQKGIWSFATYAIRDYAPPPHHSVDDTVFGGGTGMVLRPDILGLALDDVIQRRGPTPLLYCTPRGKLLTQERVEQLAKEPEITVICGRFEGIDQRVIEHYAIEEISLGDYVLSGGELPTLTLMDACIRLLPGVLDKKEATQHESHASQGPLAGLLEYPLYTRPALWRDHPVPPILQSGHHAHIEAWRLSEAEHATKTRRPDLWKKYCERR